MHHCASFVIKPVAIKKNLCHCLDCLPQQMIVLNLLCVMSLLTYLVAGMIFSMKLIAGFEPLFTSKHDFFVMMSIASTYFIQIICLHIATTF